jgi:hypothetical protein
MSLEFFIARRYLKAKRKGLFAVVATSIGIAGCTSWAQKAWPPRQEALAGGRGALLFALKPDLSMGEYQGGSMLVRWPERNAPDQITWYKSQHYRMLFQGQGPYADEVVLIPLNAGEYPRTILRIFYVGYQQHYEDLEPDPPVGFTIEPGKVTVLGRLNLNANLGVQAETGTSRQFTLAAKFKIDDSPATKSAVIAAALNRPDAAALDWRDALEAARAPLSAAPGR